jgi:hypothetical protein
LPSTVTTVIVLHLCCALPRNKQTTDIFAG